MQADPGLSRTGSSRPTGEAALALVAAAAMVALVAPNMAGPESLEGATEARKTEAATNSGAAPRSERVPANWSYQPISRPTPPAVRDAAWPRNDVDRFILARLEAHGMGPAEEAGRRVLLRRAYLDLVGIPPTAEESDAFVADRSPDAYERRIDALLASPMYGERCGRHWLDVARYADSNGVDENIAYANAFRYRDYVIDAFNRDLPFDQFLTEQIAGDLLP